MSAVEVRKSLPSPVIKPGYEALSLLLIITCCDILLTYTVTNQLFGIPNFCSIDEEGTYIQGKALRSMERPLYQHDMPQGILGLPLSEVLRKVSLFLCVLVCVCVCVCVLLSTGEFESRNGVSDVWDLCHFSFHITPLECAEPNMDTHPVALFIARKCH